MYISDAISLYEIINNFITMNLFDSKVLFFLYEFTRNAICSSLFLKNTHIVTKELFIDFSLFIIVLTLTMSYVNFTTALLGCLIYSHSHTLITFMFLRL